MADNTIFEKAMEFTRIQEGGFAEDKNNLRGRTNFGITQEAYNVYLAKKEIKTKNVRYILPAEVTDIYQECWLISNCDSIIGNKLAVVNFDTAFKMGYAEAATLLKESKFNAEEYIELRKKAYYGYAYRDIKNKIPRIINGKNQSVFLDSWLRRCDALGNCIKTIKDKILQGCDYQTALDITIEDHEQFLE